MGQYYFPVFLGDKPHTAATEKQIAQLEKLLKLKEATLQLGTTLGVAHETAEASTAKLRATIEKLKIPPTDGEFIRAWMNPHEVYNGVKLTEHAYAVAATVQAAIFYLSPEGHFYKSRLVWAGDYADPEPDAYTPISEEHTLHRDNLHHRAYDQPSKCITAARKTKFAYDFFVNHSKREYVKLRPFESGGMPHPIPLLTAEGNGRGGGDYHGKGEELVGTWARDVVSVEKEPPAGFTELEVAFDEDA